MSARSGGPERAGPSGPMAHTTAYTIGTAARLTGVPAWRLRAWESAGLLRPDRSASGYRIYERADLDQISRLNDAIARGGRLAAHALVERPAGEPSSDNGAEPRPRADEILASLARIAGAEWCGLLWPDRQGRLAILATAGAGAPRPRALTAEEEVAWTRVTLHEHVSVQPPDLAPFASGELTTTIVRSTGTRGAIVLARARNALAPDVARLAVLAVTRQAELMRERDRHDRRQEELLVARAFGTALASHGEMDDLLEAALDQFIDFTRFDAGLVGLADPTGRRFVAAAARGFSARFLDGIRDFRTDEGIAGRAYTAGRPMIVRDLRTDPRVTRAPVRAEGLRTYLSIPLLHRHRAIGLVELGSRRPDMARSGDVEYLMVLTEILAAAVVNIQLADRLAIEREERANLVRSWGADIAAARTAGLAAAASRLERMHVGGGDLAGLIGELRRPGASCFDPDEIVAQALAAGRRDGSGVRVMVTS
ncbi:MAG: diguanylate cyclase, partial [Solirubrobacteraceae bacterium]|nr:diguanylate cyclase [Solirubrobacteraceae bacterium]